VHGAVAGWLVLIPDGLTFGGATLVDLHVHPAYRQDAPKLLAAVRRPEAGRLTAYTAEPAEYRAALLEGVGFRPVATLPGWLEHDGGRLGLVVLEKGARALASGARGEPPATGAKQPHGALVSCSYLGGRSVGTRVLRGRA
jgi:hypothetical protein